MNLMIAAGTDKGSSKEVNQDSLLVRQLRIEGHHVAVAIVSDGIGGEFRGDVASAAVVKSFERWIDRKLPELIREKATRNTLRISWKEWVDDVNEKLNKYGTARGVMIGATATILLIIDDLHFILNVGDSRVYRFVAGKMQQITEDQTLAALAVRRGEMTEEEAEKEGGQSVLAQAVGMNARCLPDLYAGRMNGDTVFLLCTDGFRHKISAKEIAAAFAPDRLTSKEQLNKQIDHMIVLNRRRGETDNMSVILVKTY